MAGRVPFDFDTSETPSLVIRGVAAMLVVEVAGIAYLLIVPGNRAGAVAMLISAAMTVYFSRLFLRSLEGSTGRISTDEVTVQRVRVLGLPLAGQDGRFPIRGFKAVRVERVPPRADARRRRHARYPARADRPQRRRDAGPRARVGSQARVRGGLGAVLSERA
jgi:hypothetical protein